MYRLMPRLVITNNLNYYQILTSLTGKKAYSVGEASRLRFKRIKWNEKITNHVRHPFNARQSSLCIFFYFSQNWEGEIARFHGSLGSHQN